MSESRLLINTPVALIACCDLFEGVSSTTVILAPGACRRGALNSTSCVDSAGKRRAQLANASVCDEFQEALFWRQAWWLRDIYLESGVQQREGVVFWGKKTPLRGNATHRSPLLWKRSFWGEKKRPCEATPHTGAPCLEKTLCFVDFCRCILEFIEILHICWSMFYYFFMDLGTLLDHFGLYRRSFW